MNIVEKIACAAALPIILVFAAPMSFARTATVHVTLEGEAGGTMALKIDKPTIPAGNVDFDVSNAAYGTEHEMVLVKVKSKDAKLPMIKDADRIDEKKLKSLGEVADLGGGKSGHLKVKLAPGNYVLFCNIKGHYMAGMHAPLTVIR
jgi:uncharacterized cupredoxin-like copper-binding protein